MDRRRTVVAVALAVGVVALTAAFGLQSGPALDRGGADAVPASTIDGHDLGNRTVGYTHQRGSGNRVFDGTAALTDAEPWSVGIPGRPRWVVGVPDGDGTVWAAVLASGRTRGFRVGDGGVTSVAVEPDRVDPATPPALAVLDGQPTLLVPPNGSRYAHPVVTDDVATWLTDDGSLVVRDAGTADGVHDVDARVPLDPLPDARLAVADGIAAVLVGPTRRYRHGVLGDDVEASAVALVDLTNGSLLRRIAPPGDLVIEGLQPIITDVGDGDSAREVLVTASGDGDGARLVALDQAGDVAAMGPSFGRTHRWRHQVAATEFHGGREAVAVETPHIGGTARFHGVEGDRFRVVAAAGVVLSSHVIGSRNLDAVAAGDLDDDGATEVLAPAADRRSLVAVERTGTGAGEDWRVAAGGRITTNLASATVDGGTAVAVGTEEGIVVWRPPR